MEDEAWSAADGWEDDDWLRPVRSGVPYVSEKKKKAHCKSGSFGIHKGRTVYLWLVTVVRRHLKEPGKIESGAGEVLVLVDSPRTSSSSSMEDRRYLLKGVRPRRRREG